MAGRKTDAPIPEGTPDRFRCHTCKITKPRECFSRSLTRARGFAYECQDCQTKRNLVASLKRQIRAVGLAEFDRRTAEMLRIASVRAQVASEWARGQKD